MENINLASGTVGRGEDRKEIIGASLKWILALVVLVVIAYLAMVMYKGYLGRSIDNVSAEYQEKRNDFVGQNAKEVLDFQNRLDFAKSSAESQRDSVLDLREIERLIIAGSYVASYEYDKDAGAITLDCLADNYDIMAKQILSFRGSSYFSIVSAGESTLDTKTNKVSFPITLKIN
ncbi:MAG: hypothetical protein HGB08_04725 [Candidatus Moranbacteria bacterium]|nr:hypothetical protein [Candidatus Moranbacteria bacterium]